MRAIAKQEDIERATKLYRAGKFEEVIQLFDADDGPFNSEEIFLLKARAQMAIGKYADAKSTIEQGIEDVRTSVRLRWLGARVSDYNNDPGTAIELRNKIGEMWDRSAWQFRSKAPALLVIGRYYLSTGLDPKTVLDDFYMKARDEEPADPKVYMAIGDLALEKHDYELAARNYAKAVELDPGNPDAHLALAEAYRPSLADKATESLNNALAINPDHIGALLVLVEQHLSAEFYEEAEKKIKQILDVNPHQPEAWAYRAVLAHLDNDPSREGECRDRALANWRGNPEVDYLIGYQLSRKYRFEEASTYQRRALVYDSNFVPAKIQLAHDLLRLGQELEGWKLAEEVFDADQYNVVANNLVALRDNLSEFATLERNGFVVRMDRREAEVYGDLVLQLVEEAEQKLAGKYEVELQKPVFIEIFPRQQDFAIRTFGLPGGAGFLGVCFGRVVTMNSPAAQGASLTNWRSVLWHEFCHVVTLQKTKNKMPRWLSEGISVYEEKLADDAWGDSINPRYREMILGGELTPVSQLSSAFLRPKTGLHLQFAYYESSLVVRFLVEEFGAEAINKLLLDLSRGTPVNDALRRHSAPTDYLDKRFEEYATAIANGFAPDADWTRPQQPVTTAAGWLSFLEAHPDNVFALLGLAEAQIEEREFSGALQTLRRFDELYPETGGRETVWKLRALAHRGLDNVELETAALEKMLSLDASDAAACLRLLEIYVETQSWDHVKRVSRRLQGIDPMLKSAHSWMAMAAEKSGDDEQTIRALSALVALGPFDKADVHYRLASAQFRRGLGDDAKRNALLALEVAPRYRDAHKLLLEIVAAGTEVDEPEPAETVERPALEIPDYQTNEYEGGWK